MFDPNQCSSLSFSQVLSNFPKIGEKVEKECGVKRIAFVRESVQVIDADLPQTFKSTD